MNSKKLLVDFVTVFAVSLIVCVNWHDGQAGTELNFKFYRQATNKIGGISAEAAAFLGQFF